MAGSDDASRTIKPGEYYLPEVGVISPLEAHEIRRYVYCFSSRAPTSFNDGKLFKARCGSEIHRSNSFTECVAWLEAMILVNP